MLDACGTQQAILGINTASGDNLLLVLVKNSPCYTFSVFNTVATYGSTTITPSTWHSILVTYQYNSSTGKTDIKHYLDLVMDVSTVGNTKIVDDVNGKMSIGQEYDANSRSDYFKGFVWEVVLYNYAISFTDYQTLLSSPGRPSSPCTFSQYANPDGTCGNCLPSCTTTGCVDSDNCSLCADERCGYCTDFAPGSCVSCITNASVIGGVCVCNDGFYHVLVSNTCLDCDSTCGKCTDAGPNKCTGCKSDAELGGNTCVCSTGYYPSPGGELFSM